MLLSAIIFSTGAYFAIRGSGKAGSFIESPSWTRQQEMKPVVTQPEETSDS